MNSRINRDVYISCDGGMEYYGGIIGSIDPSGLAEYGRQFDGTASILPDGVSVVITDCADDDDDEDCSVNMDCADRSVMWDR